MLCTHMSKLAYLRVSNYLYYTEYLGKHCILCILLQDYMMLYIFAFKTIKVLYINFSINYISCAKKLHNALEKSEIEVFLLVTDLF